MATSPTAAARPRATAVKVSRRTLTDATATQQQFHRTQVRPELIEAVDRVSGGAQETPASQTQAVLVESTETENGERKKTTGSANGTQQSQQAVLTATEGTSASPLQPSTAMQEQSAWQSPPQMQGLLSGPCLVAAGALACSFISLQVG